MVTLDKKVFRQLGSMKAQAITISFVVASGVAIFIAARSAYDSLRIARDDFYTRFSFAQGFVSLKSAPRTIGGPLGEIPGMGVLQARIVQEAVLDFPEETLPTAGRFVSITEGLNRLALRKGRLPKGEKEVVVSEAFALANRLQLGSQISAIMLGKKRVLKITGIALSPEFVYVFRPSNPLPDDKHFGLLWMDLYGMETLFNMEGATNDIVFTFSPDADVSTTLKKVDDVLRPYGGLGAIDRNKNPSHSFLRDEFNQLQTTAISMPLIFLGVAAFLLHMVATRIITKEREQIATLKALGYKDSEIAYHYLKIVSLISLIGSVLGILLGIYLGVAMKNLYGDFYRFPNLVYQFNPLLVLHGIGVGLLAGGVGSAFSIRKVLKLNPAQAMRPPIPEVYSKSMFENLNRSLPMSGRMALRNLTRRPLRTFLAVFGISTSVMIMVLGMFMQDAVNRMLEIQFDQLQRESVTISFLNPVSTKSILELKSQEGVLLAEGYRMIPVRIRKGHLSKELGLQGIPEKASLRRLVGVDGSILRPPASGVYLNVGVAEKLNIRAGDKIRIEVLEGQRREFVLPVEKLVDEILGQGIYMERTAINRLIGDGDNINLIALRTDPSKEVALLTQLKTFPKVAGVSTRDGTLGIFKETMARSVLSTMLILLAFASIIAVGVIYNTGIITLSERMFELGSLRILGFLKSEVFSILGTELGLEILASIPLGCVLGYLFAFLLMQTVQTEGFRLPLVISRNTYGIAVLTTILTSCLTFVVLYIRIIKMDLIAVLKVRE